jgi:hypothetical protein
MALAETWCAKSAEVKRSSHFSVMHSTAKTHSSSGLFSVLTA